MRFEMCLRKEWRIESGLLRRVVAYYKPGELEKPCCVNPWPDRPTRRNKYVMYNCFKYHAVWLDDQPEPAKAAAE
jgi:hypothetical protein